MHHLGTTVFQIMALSLLLAKICFCLAIPALVYLLWPHSRMLSPSHSLFISNKHHTSHRKRKELGGGYSDKTLGTRTSLFLPLAFIFWMFLWGNWTQKGHLASWQLREVGVGNIKQKQTINMRCRHCVFVFLPVSLERISYLLIIHMPPTSSKIFEADQCNSISVTPAAS